MGAGTGPPSNTQDFRCSPTQGPRQRFYLRLDRKLEAGHRRYAGHRRHGALATVLNVRIRGRDQRRVACAPTSET